MSLPDHGCLLHVFTSRGRIVGFSVSKAGKLQSYLNEEFVRGRITSCTPTGGSLLVSCQLDSRQQTDNLFFLHLRPAFAN